jgi:DNA-binding NarL/FixJ family response regulator
MQEGKVIRIVIADDHMIIRDGLRLLIDKQPDMELVAEADNGRTAITHVQNLSPDVVIMDIGMRELNGIDATRLIIKKTPDVKVIALSMYSDKQFIKEMLKAGASGYLLKDSAFKELLDAIRMVVNNNIYISPSITGIITEDYLQFLTKAETSIRSTLSAREIEILQLLVESHSVKAIATTLCISIKTVETHRQNIMKKLDIHNMIDLTKYAIREGIISL